MPSTLEQKLSFKLTLIDSQMRFFDSKEFNLTYQMFSMPADDDVLAQSKYQNSAFLKINYFVKDVLDGSLAFTMDEMDLASKFLSEFDNNFLVLPDLDDVTLLQAIHSKLSVIAGERTLISDLKLEDCSLGLSYNFFLDEDTVYTSLPSQQEWLGELSFWDEPWWSRYDVLTFDNVATDAEERDAHKADKDQRESIVQPLLDIDDSVDELLAKVQKQLDNAEHEPAELISLDSVRKKKSKWTPTIV